MGRLPPEQMPDAVVCLVDSSRVSAPRNLHLVPGPKVLLVADTHHLKRPILGMIDYIVSQAFDRVVFLYTRHHLDLFRAAGIRNLFWFPGLTFPHGDAVVKAARRAGRESRIALVGQVGSWHERRLRLSGLLVDRKLPLTVVSKAQQEALDYYGSSLIGLNVSLNGDLNLRCFEIMAAGGAAFVDRPALARIRAGKVYGRRGRGLLHLRHAGGNWSSGPASFLPDRPRLGLPGEAAAAWFDAHFNEKRRRAAFASLVCDGRAPTEFAEREPLRPVFSSSRHPEQTRTALQVYEEIQEVHGQQESLRIVFDPGVPANFERLFRTLPRVEIARIGAAGSDTVARPADLAVVGHSTAKARGFGTPERVWIWDGAPGAAFPSGPSAPGYQKYCADPEKLFHVRCGLPGPETPRDLGCARLGAIFSRATFKTLWTPPKKAWRKTPDRPNRI